MNRIGFARVLAGICLASMASIGVAQQGRSRAPRAPDMVLANDKIELSIRPVGGTFSKLILKEGEPFSPLATLGHFLALDGFGGPSKEEQAAGMPFHGEASKQAVKVTAKQEEGPLHSMTMETSLPLAQETLVRTVEIADGEQVVYVTSELESLLTVDRPVSWAEHATIGPPFLDKGKTVVDMPGMNCRVRPYKPGNIPPRLDYDRDFKWPMAPGKGGGQVDIREVPTDLNALDLASCQMDPSRDLVFVTALNLEHHMLFGYVFHREQYPWVMSWMNFTGDARAARGMEFSSQPFDISHQETVALNPMFGTPTFRWLPAKSKIGTKFLFFYTAVPDSYTKIDNVTLEGGKLTILDHSGQRTVLAASRGL